MLLNIMAKILDSKVLLQIVKFTQETNTVGKACKRAVRKLQNLICHKWHYSDSAVKEH